MVHTSAKTNVALEPVKADVSCKKKPPEFSSEHSHNGIYYIYVILIVIDTDIKQKEKNHTTIATHHSVTSLPQYKTKRKEPYRVPPDFSHQHLRTFYKLLRTQMTEIKTKNQYASYRK